MAGLKDLSNVEYVLPGSAACAGCPSTTALRIVGKALGENVVMIMTPSCAVASIGLLPNSCYSIPTLNVCFASVGASAAAVSATFDAQLEKGTIKGEKPIVFNWSGDGGTYDIGLQGLSAAAERNDDFIHFCYNNESYSNTGVQRSGATPMFASTTTTPGGKTVPKKNLPLLMLDHKVPYVATASLAYPLDLYRKVEKARGMKGFRYIEIHAPCYTAWKFPSSDLVEVSRLAVKSGSWMLWEAEDGKVTINSPTSLLVSGKTKALPLEDYLSVQGRFSALMSDPDSNNLIETMKRGLEEEQRMLKNRAEATNS